MDFLKSLLATTAMGLMLITGAMAGASSEESPEEITEQTEEVGQAEEDAPAADSEVQEIEE